MQLECSVIMSTYNATAWLEKVIWGFAAQTFKDFEIIIADDGSKEETRTCLDALRADTGLRIKHVWQEDDGFQKTRILNKALKEVESPYVVFTDGDCVPRHDFLAVHMERREKGRFLSGGYFKLPMDASQKIQRAHIQSGQAFDVEWLTEHGLKSSFSKKLKLTSTGTLSSILETVTPTGATWNGHNASGWLEDIVKANGFDNRMQYGGEDRELGERLENAGIKGKQIRYSAICVHLDHARGYVNDEAWERNRAIRKETKETKRTATPDGMEQVPKGKRLDV